MKHILSILLWLAVVASMPIARAEELQDFLKRTGIGNATKSDLHENFHGSVFVGGQIFEMNRDKMVRFWEEQKAAGTKLVVDDLNVISKTETPNDDKGAVISIVVKTSVTEKVAGSTLKIQSISHFIVIRDPDGTFHLLYFAVPKQVRSA